LLQQIIIQTLHKVSVVRHRLAVSVQSARSTLCHHLINSSTTLCSYQFISEPSDAATHRGSSFRILAVAVMSSKLALITVFK